MSNKNRISFSELKIWNECAFKHKLVYIDGLKTFTGNEYTAFGTAMHYLCENLIVEKETTIDIFYKKFEEEINKLENNNSAMVADMKEQAKKIYPEILPAVISHFPEHEVFSVEEELYEDITDLVEGSGIDNFKGFVDLVLKCSDGQYHIIDWKTCSWGWDAKRKNDKLVAYQLVLYKHFFAEKHNIDPSKINIYFALLKRTASKNNVEIFKISGGEKRTNNSLNFLKKAIFNIKSKNYIKNRLSCRRCEFYETPHCP